MQEKLYSTRLRLLQNKLTVLPDKAEETAENTLHALWSTATGNPISVMQSASIKLQNLSEQQLFILDELIDKRLTGQPLAYLTGRQSFMGMIMLARKDALIPRKETEILASAAINVANEFTPDSITIIDVCTGAGNIALAIAKHCSHVNVYAADLSEEATILARENAEFLGLSSRVKFMSGDLLSPFIVLSLQGKVSLITCNPPYISTSKVSAMPTEISSHEPKLAFDGGAFGINLIKRLITEADELLTDDGVLVFEVGHGQAAMISKLVEKSGIYTKVETVTDPAGHPRVIIARK